MIGGWQLIVLLIMAHAPLNLIWGAVPTALQFGGLVATPLALAIAGLILMAFSVAYGGMARRIQHRGGISAFIAHGLGPFTAIGSSFVAMLSYTILLASLIMLMCGSAIGLIMSLFNVRVSISVCILVGTAAVMVLERLRLQTLVRVLIVFALAQAAVVVWFDVTAVSQPAGGSVSFAALDPSGLLTGSLGLTLSLAVTAFVGSETAASYVDEVEQPRRTIPRATLISYAATTVAIVVSTWAITVAVGPQNTVAAAQGQLQSQTSGAGQPFVLSVILQLVGPRHASMVADLAIATLILGCLAGGAMNANAVSRQLSALAGDGVLPAAMKPRPDGLAPNRTGFLAPIAAGILALIVANTNPSTLVLYLVTTAGLGVLGVLALTSLATVVWFLRTDDEEAGFFGWEGQVVAAGLAMVTTGFLFFFGLYRLPDVLPNGETYGWVLWAAPGIAFFSGLVVAAVVRIRQPEVLARVGKRSARAPAFPA